MRILDLTPDQMDDAQREVVDEAVAGKRGRHPGPAAHLDPQPPSWGGTRSVSARSCATTPRWGRAYPSSRSW